MILISHRGNLEGPNTDIENNPERIRQVIEMKFDVEVDVWLHKNRWYLGHDEPQYEIDFTFLNNAGLWCHAKNLAALDGMLSAGNIHCFWHQHDDFTITSRGIIWAYPGMPITKNAVAVMPDNALDVRGAYGICADNILEIGGHHD